MLSAPTLVLNKSWVVVSITTVRNALSLLYSGSARAICPETYEIHDFHSWAELRVLPHEQCIRTISRKIRVPEIILLVNYDGYPKRGVTFSRKNIYKRDDYTCQYCGSKPGISELTIEHIVPRSHGGRSTWANCVLACTTCNKKKSNKTLEETGMKLLRKPFKPKWPPQLVMPMTKVRQSWEQFISDKYWEAELE